MSRAFVPTLHDPPLQQVLLDRGGSAWQAMVACIMLGQSSRYSVDRVWPPFFDRWPECSQAVRWTPYDLLDAENLLRPSGLQGRKANTIWLMSRDWLALEAQAAAGEPIDVTRCHGLGRYAQDSYDLFVVGTLDVDPDDRVLRTWRDVLKANLAVGG